MGQAIYSAFRQSANPVTEDAHTLISSILIIGFSAGGASPQGGVFKLREPSAEHSAVLQRWLVTRPELRPATLSDCVERSKDSSGKERVDSCESLVVELGAWTKDPNVNPFYVKGDFNGDRNEDFAIVLTDVQSTKSVNKAATVAVSNGPFRRTGVVNLSFLLTRPCGATS